MGLFWKSIFVLLVAGVVYNLINDDGYEPEKIRNKRVLVTGGSQNIGEEIALQFSKLGANIVITARREAQLKEVVKKCKEMGAADANYVVADMADLEQTKMVVDKAVEIMGGLDYLVLNHMLGVSNPGLWNASQSNFEHAEKTSRVNYLSYIYLSTHATQHLTKSNGHLIVVSSLAGHFYTIYNAVYGATKAALNHFYGSLRVEMALKGKQDYSITVCLLGPIATKKNRWEKYPNQMNIKGYPMIDTAKEIIRAGATMAAYLHIPKWMIVGGIQRVYATDALDRILLKLFYNK